MEYLTGSSPASSCPRGGLPAGGGCAREDYQVGRIMTGAETGTLVCGADSLAWTAKCTANHNISVKDSVDLPMFLLADNRLFPP